MSATGSPRALPAGQLLQQCRLPRAEARSLLAHCLQCTREQLLAHPERPVGASGLERFAALAAQRRRGVPMAYLLGEREFHGHALRVTPDVLVPRPETELLVDTALEWLLGRAGARVLELGTGSGCIAIALALARPDLQIVATERSLPALRVAAGNARRLGAAVHFIGADWFGAVGGAFDLVVSNPPYVAANDAHLAQLAFEPRAALTDGGDGLADLRALIGGAPAHLAPGGLLLVEHGHDQGQQVRALMQAQGLVRVRTLRDFAAMERACAAELARL